MKKQLLMAMAVVLTAGMQIFAADLTASRPAKLASSASGLMAPVWSPDGSKIAASGNNYTGIYVINADGTNARVVTTAEGAGYKMAWSADGREIIGRTNLREGIRVMHEIKAWNVESSASRVITPKSRTNALPGTSAKSSVFATMNNDAAGAASQIPALARFAGKTVINPALSPDGSKIAFQIVGNGMWLINADGTGLRSLGVGSHPSWMPDNATVVYTIVKDNGSAFTGSTVMALNTANGRNTTLVADNSLIPLTPAVSPDGKKIVFENAVDAALYVVTLK